MSAWDELVSAATVGVGGKALEMTDFDPAIAEPVGRVDRSLGRVEAAGLDQAVGLDRTVHRDRAFFDPAADKVYRHPTFYDIPESVPHM